MIEKNDTSISYITDRGLHAGAISALVMLRRIASENTDRYTVMWEDDCVLKIPYKAFKNILLPTDADIVAFDRGFALAQPEECVKLWNSRDEKIHRTRPFYHGITGAGFLGCYAVNSKGARKLLALHEQKGLEYICYEGLMVLNPDLEGMYTYIPDIVRLTWVSGIASDIFLEANESGLPWKALSVEKLYPEV